MGRGRYKSVITRMDLCGPSIAMLLRSQPLPRVAPPSRRPDGGRDARQAAGQRPALHLECDILLFPFHIRGPSEARWLSPCRCCFDAVGRSNRLHSRIAQSEGQGNHIAYSAVCGTGLDTIPLPGDISPEQMERIFGDVASLAIKWNKPLSARLQPIRDKKSGDRTDFHDPFLFNTTVQPLP